jgi:hypothetical protein
MLWNIQERPRPGQITAKQRFMKACALDQNLLRRLSKKGNSTWFVVLT